MVRVESPKCPRCQANLTVAADAARAKCEYCGTESVIKHTRHVLGGKTMVALLLGQDSLRQYTTRFIISTVAMALLAVIALVVFLALKPDKTVVSPATRQVSSISGGGPVNLHTDQENLSFHRQPVLFERVDDDDLSDVVALTTRHYRGLHTIHLMAFSGGDGHELWRSESLGDLRHALAVTRISRAGERVVISDYKRQLLTFDIKSGKRLRAVALADVANRLCAMPDGSQVFVEVADNKLVVLDTQSMALAEVAKAPPGCQDPRQVCGSFDNAHALSATCSRVSIDASGFRSDVQLQAGDAAVLLGTKSPGSRVPMAAAPKAAPFTENAPSHASPRWSRNLATDWQPEYTEESPRWADLDATTLVALYETSHRAWRIVAIRVADGETRWDKPLPPMPGTHAHSPTALQLFGGNVVLTTGGLIMILNAETGELTATLGNLWQAPTP